jgi:hypothetical protein
MKRPLNVTVNKDIARNTTQIMIEVDVDSIEMSNDHRRAFEMVLLKLWAAPSTGDSMLEKLLAGLHQLKRAMDDAEYARQMAMKHQAQQAVLTGNPYLQGITSNAPSKFAISNVAQAANIAGITHPDLQAIVKDIYHQELQRSQAELQKQKEQQDKNLRARSWMDKLLGVK